MHTLYYFDFLKTVSIQLVESIERLSITPLGRASLQDLVAFQNLNHASQGVYLLHYKGRPVYLGKADDVAERLEQHYLKLSGRRNMILSDVAYKSILLDTSMGTAANEEILIRMFSERHDGMWNGSGFGSKDPGKERDKTKPGKFDREHPINEEFELHFYGTKHSVRAVLEIAKRELPFVFRYDVSEPELSIEISLPGTTVPANGLLSCLVDHLGEGWQGTLLSFGMTLYRKIEEYPFGKVIRPS